MKAVCSLDGDPIFSTGGIMIRKIRQAAVIGSGVMGGGIAALMASAGIRTLLMDIVPFDLKDEEKGTQSSATAS